MEPTLIDPASFPSLQDIENTVALNGDPILRNLKITQGYCALSRAMSAMVGGSNVSWCGFASWSSKTIGVSIREADMRQRGLAAITQSWLYQDTIQRIVNLLEAEGVIGIGPFDNVIAQALEDGIDSLKQGNAQVYGEIGTLYSRLISALGNDVDLDLTRLAPAIAYLDGKPSERGGQALLRQAAENYYRARASKPTRVSKRNWCFLRMRGLGSTNRCDFKDASKSFLELHWSRELWSMRNSNAAR